MMLFRLLIGSWRRAPFHDPMNTVTVIKVERAERADNSQALTVGVMGFDVARRIRYS